MKSLKPLKRVSAYRTGDGVVHDSRPAAVAHQTRLDLMALVSDGGLAMPADEAGRIADLLISNPKVVLAAAKAAARATTPTQTKEPA